GERAAAARRLRGGPGAVGGVPAGRRGVRRLRAGGHAPAAVHRPAGHPAGRRAVARGRRPGGPPVRRRNPRRGALGAPPRRGRPPGGGPRAPSEEAAALLTGYRPLGGLIRVSTSVAGAGRATGRYGTTPAATGAVHPALPFAYAACLTPGGWRIGRQGARP